MKSNFILGKIIKNIKKEMSARLWVDVRVTMSNGQVRHSGWGQLHLLEVCVSVPVTTTQFAQSCCRGHWHRSPSGTWWVVSAGASTLLDDTWVQIGAKFETCDELNDPRRETSHFVYNRTDEVTWWARMTSPRKVSTGAVQNTDLTPDGEAALLLWVYRDTSDVEHW